MENYDQLNTYTRILFEKLNNRILNLGTSVKQGFKKLCTAYKADTSFGCCHSEDQLRLAMNMKFTDVIDPKGIFKNITELGRWGAGDVEAFFERLMT
ncbi:MAG: hypothetical protein LBR98_10500 [Syntrophomonadaceae bacterium]|jgi:predicted transport protein|nr:hypothetical protein [Syntrophomonadaceae bacterium]